MIAHPYRPRDCNPGAPPGRKGRPGHLGHKGRAENTEAVNLSFQFSTAQRWQHPMHCALAIGRAAPGWPKVRAVRAWSAATRAAMGVR